MKKIFIFTVVIIFLSRVVSASAQSANQSSNCLNNIKSHGTYVSCIARRHLGGKTTSSAAQSDIGKKNCKSITPTTSPTVTITPTATVTPITTPTETVTPTSTPTVTEAPTVTPTETITPAITPVNQIDVLGEGSVTGFERLIKQLEKILRALLTFPQLN